MKLYLRRDTSSENSRFIVCDESGRPKFSVSGFATASTDRMVISSTLGNPLVTIRVARFPVFSVFSISDSSERFAMTATHLRSGGDFRFHGISWVFCRSSDIRSFEILDADKSSVMLLCADRYLSTGTYELTINCKQRELFCIAAAICADSLNFGDVAKTVVV